MRNKYVGVGYAAWLPCETVQPRIKNWKEDRDRERRRNYYRWGRAPCRAPQPFVIGLHQSHVCFRPKTKRPSAHLYQPDHNTAEKFIASIPHRARGAALLAQFKVWFTLLNGEPVLDPWSMDGWTYLSEFASTQPLPVSVANLANAHTDKWDHDMTLFATGPGADSGSVHGQTPAARRFLNHSHNFTDKEWDFVAARLTDMLGEV